MSDLSHGVNCILEYGGTTFPAVVMYSTDSVVVVKVGDTDWPIVIAAATMAEVRYNYETGEVEEVPEGAVLCQLAIGETIH